MASASFHSATSKYRAPSTNDAVPDSPPPVDGPTDALRAALSTIVPATSTVRAPSTRHESMQGVLHDGSPEAVMTRAPRFGDLNNSSVLSVELSLSSRPVNTAASSMSVTLGEDRPIGMLLRYLKRKDAPNKQLPPSKRVVRRSPRINASPPSPILGGTSQPVEEQAPPSPRSSRSTSSKTPTSEGESSYKDASEEEEPMEVSETLVSSEKLDSDDETIMPPPIFGVKCRHMTSRPTRSVVRGTIAKNRRNARNQEKETGDVADDGLSSLPVKRREFELVYMPKRFTDGRL